MASDPNIGKVQHLEVKRTGPGTFSIFVDVVGDGLNMGGMADYVVRAHHSEERWWLMTQLADTEDGGEIHHGAVLEIPMQGPIPKAGRTTLFKVQTYRLMPDGSKVWGHKTPGENDGTGPAHAHTWGPWPSEEEPDDPAPPPPTPGDNPIVKAVPVEGERDVLDVTWEDGSQQVLGRVGFYVKLPGWLGGALFGLWISRRKS